MNTPADPLIDAIEADKKASGVKPITLKWKGSKIPRGHSVNGVEIGWAQNGVVNDINGEILGTYKRIVEFGGKDFDEHEMIIVPWN